VLEPRVTKYGSYHVSSGVVEAAAFGGEPDEQGRLLVVELPLPPFKQIVYYAALQRHDPLQQGDLDIFPEGYNRVQPLRITDFHGLKRGGLFLVAELASGEFQAVLPLVARDTMAWFEELDGKLMLAAGHLGTEPFRGDLPLCVWARSANLYAACEQAWREAVAHPAVSGSTRMREEKHYPPLFEYLGWCSWEQYHAAIDEGVLLAAMDGLEASGLPIRYVLVDDGHLTHRQRKLVSLAADGTKFANGWGPLLARRRDDGIAWLGLWLNFNGYWNGIDPDNQLDELNEHLATVPKHGALQPRDGFLHAFAFYDAMIGAAREAGFDFVKVDNQAQNATFYVGTDNAVRPAVHNSQALEAACARHMDGLINCMAHNSPCAFNTRVSAVTRCSEDYKLNDAWRAKAHLHNSYANLLWLGQTVWGDHDMFHSSDGFAGRMMAVSKAVSGGPVYVSDAPGDLDVEAIARLCCEDGRLPRPLAPAAPLPDSVFANPFVDPVAYRVIAPLPHGAAAVVVYNLTEPSVPVSGRVRPSDYVAAGGLMQDYEPEWELPDEGLVLVDYYAGQAAKLGADGYGFELPGFEDRLYLLCPVQHGWAVLGRTDKYLGPALTEVLDANDLELIVRLEESGPLGLWCAGTPLCAAGEVVALGGGHHRIALPVGESDLVVRIRRA